MQKGDDIGVSQSTTGGKHISHSMSETKTQEEQQPQSGEEKIVSLKVVIPGSDEPLEIPCSVEDTLFDITETLKVLPSTREYTAYKLKLNGATFPEETLIGDLLKNGENAKLILEPSPYNEITARKHVVNARIAAGLDSQYDSFAEYSGVNAGASTYAQLNLNETVSQAKKEKENQEENKKDEAEDNFKVTDDEKKEIKEIVDQMISLSPQLDSVATVPPIKPSPALKSLFISQWYPADMSRKLAGDLFYLQVKTLENSVFNITAHVSGFFVNGSSDNKFDGSISTLRNVKTSMDYSLLSLLKALSPSFEKQLAKNDEILSKCSLETYTVPTSTVVTAPWLVSKVEAPTPDLGKSQYNYLYGGIDGSDLQVDWNKDYQFFKDLPTEDLTQRFNREQTLISNTSDFTSAATKGAMSVIRGEIEPVNPEEDPQFHVFLKNGIFYSKAVDSIGQFQESGGNDAARTAAGKDIGSLKYLNKYDIKGIHSLLTTVVDYLGQRIVCQAPVPGILATDENIPVDGEELPELEQSVKYGFIDDHSDVVADQSFAETFKEVGEAFHLKPHKVWNKDGSKVVDVVTSASTKGTKGSDERKYIIDLFRTTPLDIEFIEEHYDSKNADSYPHREATLRHEAINEWIKRETAVAVKKETEKLEKEGKVDPENKPTIGIDNSLFLLNPDAFSLTPAPTSELAAELKKDEEKVREVSKFVGGVLVPEFIKDMERSEVYNAIDGIHLSKVLHESGINVRYLGKIAKLALERKNEYLKEQQAKLAEIAKINEEVEAQEAKEATDRNAKLEALIAKKKEADEKKEDYPEFKAELEALDKEFKEQAKEKEEEDAKATSKINTVPVANLLQSLHDIALQEMIARAAKHFLRKQLENIPLPLAPYVISHIHNCLLASSANPEPEAPKLNPLLAGIYKDFDLSILKVNSKYVLDSVSKEVFLRYRYVLPENWAESVKPIQLLRSIALKFGIQWKIRDFAFTKEQLEAQINNQKPKEDTKSGSKKPSKNLEVVSVTFVPEDILCIAPVVKDSIFESNSVPAAWETAIIKLASKEKEEIQEGYFYANQAIQFAERLYGPVNNITATYLTSLGALFKASNDSADAVQLYKKAFQIFERCAGIDSFQSSLALNQLADVLLSNNEPANVMKVYKRLVNSWIFAFDETHSNVHNLLTSAAIILIRLGMNAEAIKVFNKLVELSVKSYGEISQQAAFYHSQLCNLLFGEKKYAESLEHAKLSFEAYKVTLGLKDKSTLDAKRNLAAISGYVQHLKEEAKNSQKREQEARRLEQQQNIHKKEIQRAKQPAPNPELAQKSIDDIVAFINGGSSSDKKPKQKKNKKNSKK